jgi:excisionase family DNA binding protein
MSELIEINKVAEMLHISTGRLSTKAASGEIKAYKPGNKWLFKMEDIEAYLEDCSNQNKKEAS